MASELLQRRMVPNGRMQAATPTPRVPRTPTIDAASKSRAVSPLVLPEAITTEPDQDLTLSDKYVENLLQNSVDSKAIKLEQDCTLSDQDVEDLLQNPEDGISGYFDNACKHDVILHFGRNGRECLFAHKAILRRRSSWFKDRLERAEKSNAKTIYINVDEALNSDVFTEVVRLMYDRSAMEDLHNEFAQQVFDVAIRLKLSFDGPGMEENSGISHEAASS